MDGRIRLQRVMIVALVVTACGGSVTGAQHSDENTVIDSGDADPSLSSGDSGSGSGDPGDGDQPFVPATADDVWSPLTVMRVEDPRDHGAKGDGATNDLAALSTTIDALPANGGLVFFDAATFVKEDVLYIRKSHVKLWSMNRQATLFSKIQGQRRKSGVICEGVMGCGVFGLRFTSDAHERFDGLEDNQIATDGASAVEVVGNEIDGSPATGMVFVGASHDLHIEGNYVHHTWADSIHHTDGARDSWVYDNWFFNEPPSDGDDGIACVTYCPTCPKCGAMEWWSNTHLGGTWGRGYSVIGGDHIHVHHNWALHVAGASLIVASESAYDSASSNDIAMDHNWLYDSATIIGQPAILVSGLNDAAPALTNLTFSDNVAVESNVGDFRAEGSYSKVSNTGLSTSAQDFPGPLPTLDDIVMRDTSVLATADVSFVDLAMRRGLYRIHVRKNGKSFEQRFEYVVHGSATAVQEWVDTSVRNGDALIEVRLGTADGYALVLTATPRAVPEDLAGVGFSDLRAGDASGSLSWLWIRLKNRAYGAN